MQNQKEKKVIHSIRTQVDSFGRKKYRLEQVAQQDQSEEQQIQNNAVIDTGRHKSMLVGREEGLDIEKYVGKIQTNKKKKVTEVFYCDVCSQGFKCDLAYITHLNSPAHNRKLGMNMKVKAVSLETVSSKISSLLNKKDRKKQQQQEVENEIVSKLDQGKLNSNIQRKQSKDQDEEDRQNEDSQLENSVKKQDNVVKKQEKKQQEDQEQADEQNEDQMAELQMMRQMGLPTAFGSKKHKR